MTLVVKRYAKAAGPIDYVEDPEGRALRFSGHSLRRGFLSNVERSGSNLLKMASDSRHKLMEVFGGYVSEENRFENHPEKRPL